MNTNDTQKDQTSQEDALIPNLTNEPAQTKGKQQPLAVPGPSVKTVVQKNKHGDEMPPPPADDAPQIEHDRYWLENVYQADTMQQMTFRAMFTGCLIGGIMSFSNLYVGLKSGWGLGASITAAIIAFAFFSSWEKIKAMITGKPIDDHFTILENNTMQTAASSAGYMTSAGLVSAVPALYMVTGQTLSFGQTMVWLVGVSLLGVVAAIPVKRKLINQERLKFPSGIACAETLKSLHASGAEGVAKARALFLTSGLAGAFELGRSGLAIFPAKFKMFGASLASKTVVFETSMWTLGAGAIMGVRVTAWMTVGAIGTFAIAPEYLFNAGFITCGTLPESGVCGFENIGYRDITGWTLWPGVALMVAHSLVGLSFQAPKMIKGLMQTFKGGSQENVNILKDIEIPATWFYMGLAIAGTLSIVLQNSLFGIPVLYGIVSVLLALVLSFVAARSTGETDITPVGAMGKVTQLVFGGVLKGQIAPNLMAANVTGGAASQVGDLLTDMKTGYALGAKPRYQMFAQIAGVFVGSIFATAAYSLLVDPTQLGGEEWPAPAAVVWAKVAELLSKGLDNIESHKLLAMALFGGIGAVAAVIETFVPKTRKFMPSMAAIGIAMMVPFYYSLSMLIGALAGSGITKWNKTFATGFLIVIASGLIAGETLMGVAIKAWEILAPMLGLG